MIKIFTLCFLFLFPALLFAQQNKAPGKVTFKVSNPKAVYKVFPADSVLWANLPNQITLRISGGKKKALKLFVQDGTITGKDSTYTILVNKGKKTVFSVYEKSANGRNKLVYTKPYTIKHIPDPVVNVCGVKRDSVIDKDQLIQEDFLFAYSEYYKKRLPVISFNVIFVKGEDLDTLAAKGNHFSIDMRREIFKLKPGDILQFEKIRCTMPDGQPKTLKPIKIFIDETNYSKVGYRKIGN